MRVLSIGTDRELFREGSAVRRRIVAYSTLLEELHIIVFTKKGVDFVDTFIAPNIYIYPTQSVSRWLYVHDAVGVAKRLFSQNKIIRKDLVVTAQDPFESGLAASKIANEYCVSLHIQIHTDFLSSEFKTSLLQYVRVWIAKHLLPYADRVRVVSERIADSIARSGIHLKHPPIILPIRVNREAIEQAVPDEKSDLHALFPQFSHIVLMASRLSPEKNIRHALQACANIVNRSEKPFSGLGLIIAGNGSERRSLEKYAEELGISKHIVFLGVRHDIPQLLKSADMFLSTSQFEGYGMSIVEAALAGCPVITTNVGIAAGGHAGGHSEGLLKDNTNALVVPVGDVAAIEHAIVYYIEQPEQRKKFAEELARDIGQTIPGEKEYAELFVKNLETALVP